MNVDLAKANSKVVVEPALGTSFSQAYGLQKKGHFHRAAKSYAELIRSGQGSASIYNNLGNCLRSLGQFEKAIRCFDEALKLEPGRASSRLNRGLAKLALGEYREAWSDYEARLELIDFRSKVVQRRELQWQGERLGQGETLYLYGGQGLGDELQCWRFIPEAASRADKVVLELQKPMLALTAGLPANVSVIERSDVVPHFDRWAELFSLPGLFGVEMGNLPDPVAPRFERSGAVLQAIAEDAAEYPGGRRIGLVWSGNPENDLNPLRACGLGHLEPLLSLPGCRFYSLQKGAPARELEQRGLGPKLCNLAPVLTDFSATVTAIEALDLVITTDTSIPHLSGTLGVETWLLLHRPSDWRWGQEGDRSEWYPSLRVFRQKQMRDWAPVIREVAEAIVLGPN